jgi:hypothetical protein
VEIEERIELTTLDAGADPAAVIARDYSWRGHDYETVLRPLIEEQLVQALGKGVADAQLVFVGYSPRNGRFFAGWDLWIDTPDPKTGEKMAGAWHAITLSPGQPVPKLKADPPVRCHDTFYTSGRAELEELHGPLIELTID